MSEEEKLETEISSSFYVREYDTNNQQKVHRVEFEKATSDGDVYVSKDGVPILYIPHALWQDLKRVL